MHLRKCSLSFTFVTLFLCVRTAVLATPASSTEQVSLARRTVSKYVFAHFMIGIVPNYGVSDWKMDMAYAMEIGIDAFALNCASVDSYTPTQLAYAYQAAEEVGFKVFISFDFSYWKASDTGNITTYMNRYASHPAQMRYANAAVVSTFIGDTFDWAPVKNGISHKLFAIPNLQSPHEITTVSTDFDGVFSWYAWPTDGDNSIIQGPMTDKWDQQFITNLAGRPYMAPVSAWFAPHFSGKNWVFICEQLISDRWNELLALKPELIQIISWNDFGESHYISPSESDRSDDGSSQWTNGFPHDGWRIITKAYIAAYKSDASAPVITQDQIIYWYRPTPKGTKCTGDSIPAPTGIEYLADAIFITTMLTSQATLVVTSGSNTAASIAVAAGLVTSNVTMGVGYQKFSVIRNGVTILSGTGGLKITNSCTHYNFNAYVGSINSTVASPSSGTSSRSSSSSSQSSTSLITRSALISISSSTKSVTTSHALTAASKSFPTSSRQKSSSNVSSSKSSSVKSSITTVKLSSISTNKISSMSASKVSSSSTKSTVRSTSTASAKASTTKAKI